MNNLLKFNKLSIIFILVFATILPATAQDSIKHRFTKLAFEVRAEFNLDHHYPYPDSLQNTEYGLNGKYFNIAVGGEFCNHFEYFFRQRVVANPGSVSFFDNTDFLYLQYNIKRWSLRAGKEALAVGGFEYDAAPIDVFFYTKLWGSIYCFQPAVSAFYRDKSGHHQITLQIGNSPYVHSNINNMSALGSEWKKGLLAYSFMWNCTYPHFKAIYSVNMFERERGKFVNYISLGNKIIFDHFDWYIDYMNRAAVYNKYFSDFTVVSCMNIYFNHGNIFIKGGYDQNKSEDFGVENPKEIMVKPGQQYYFYGLGVEIFPTKDKSVRLHAYVANAQTIETDTEQHKTRANNLSACIGVSWNIDFLRYFGKHLNRQ